MSQAIIDFLPLETLSWERYQIFCTEVLFQRPDMVDAREYLSVGSKQDGIDIYSIRKGDSKKSVAQCKREKYLSPKDVDELIDEFINGDLTADVYEFILCTSFDLSKHRNESAISRARKKLATNRIDLIVWDLKGISLHLRLHPALATVYHFFKENIAKSFYGDIWDEYIERLREVPKNKYKYPEDHIQRTIIGYTNKQFKQNKTSWFIPDDSKLLTIADLFEESLYGNGRRVVLLSIAGFGKTVELNVLAAINSAAEKPTHPVKYLLRDYEGQTIEMLLSNYNNQWENIPDNTLLLLFDGLDEIKEQHTQAFINHLNSFLQNHPLTSTLVTSRYNFYDLKQQQLREFDIFILSPLSQRDINNYIAEKLGVNENTFNVLLEQNKFIEYANNPYYLTRLVRFYKDHVTSFPKNKSQLFSRILFEQLDIDEAKFKDTGLKERLLPHVQKLAFCMTLCGKSAITQDEFQLIIPDKEIRRDLRNFCILNLNDTATGYWSFEHKNLQEFLCASLFANNSFDKIHELISFSFNRDKLLPRFLNTISFLFEISDKGADLFQKLFDWLQSYQPELFIRFEKEQIAKEKRQEIFKTIFNYYQQKQITLRISSNFRSEELAEFTGIDKPIIDFLESKLDSTSDNNCAYDILHLLGYCKKPYLYKNQLLKIFYKALDSDIYASYVKEECIYSLIPVGSSDKNVFDRIIASAIDVTDFNIRRVLIRFLEESQYYDDNAGFILDSIQIYEKGNSRMLNGLQNETLIRLILKLDSSATIIKIIQRILSNIHLIPLHNYRTGICFGYDDVKLLLSKCAVTEKKDSTPVFRLVYKLFRKLKGIQHDNKMLQIFKEYFLNTCGTELIFRKIYKTNRQDPLMLQFADQNSIDFIIEEHSKLKLSDAEIIVIRNRLSWSNEFLSKYFLDKLNSMTDNKFKYDEIHIDHKGLSEAYVVKNQEMLLNKFLYIEEVENIFKVIPKEIVSYEDLDSYDNKNLEPFRYSLALETIGHSSLKSAGKSISKDKFLDSFSNEASWENFVIQETEEILKNKPGSLIQALMDNVQNWLKIKIETTDFTNSIKDGPANSIIFDRDIELIKELFLLVDIELADSDLLKMLESDYSGQFPNEEISGISSKIIKRVRDKILLRQKVLANIRSGKMAKWVLVTHFNICGYFKIQESLADLYAMIIADTFFDSSSRRKLTELYLELGGEISDFALYLKTPVFERDEDYLISWEWLLIELFMQVEPEKVICILLDVSNDSTQSLKIKIYALKLLLQMGSTNALDLWAAHIRTHHKIPFEHDIKSMHQYISLHPDNRTIDIFIESLDYSFENKLFVAWSYDSIQEFIYNSLILLVAKNGASYSYINEKIGILVNKYSNADFIQQIIIFQERFKQRFFENHEYRVEIWQADEKYQTLVSGFQATNLFG